MATISGIVTLGASETPGEATVLLLDATLENVVDSTTSDPVTGEYEFTGLAGATVFFVMVLGDGVYLSRSYGPITTDNPDAHAYWRVYITEVQGGVSTSPSIAEIEMRATLGGADQCSGGASISGGDYPGYGKDNAFDNFDNSRWAGPASLPNYIGYHFAAPVAVQQFAIRAPDSGNYASTQMLRDFTLEWSDDGAAWTTVATYTGESALSASEQRTYSTANYATWNPADKHADITLSDGDLTATKGGSNANATIRATVGKSSGKWYFEILVVATSISPFATVGLVPSGLSLSSFPGATIDSWSYYQQTGQKYTNNTPASYGAVWDTNGDVVGVAVDLDAGTVEFFKNGVSQGVAFTGLSGTLYPAVSLYPVAAIITARFNPADFSYSAPLGFTPGWEV